MIQKNTTRYINLRYAPISLFSFTQICEKTFPPIKSFLSFASLFLWLPRKRKLRLAQLCVSFVTLGGWVKHPYSGKNVVLLKNFERITFTLSFSVTFTSDEVCRLEIFYCDVIFQSIVFPINHFQIILHDRMRTVSLPLFSLKLPSSLFRLAEALKGRFSTFDNTCVELAGETVTKRTEEKFVFPAFFGILSTISSDPMSLYDWAKKRTMPLSHFFYIFRWKPNIYLVIRRHKPKQSTPHWL